MNKCTFITLIFTQFNKQEQLLYNYIQGKVLGYVLQYNNICNIRYPAQIVGFIRGKTVDYLKLHGDLFC